MMGDSQSLKEGDCYDPKKDQSGRYQNDDGYRIGYRLHSRGFWGRIKCSNAALNRFTQTV